MKFHLIRTYKIWFGLSLAVILVGLVFFLTQGFNYGIDFTGGTMIQIDLHQRVERPVLVQDLASLNLNPEIVHAGLNNEQIVIKTTQKLDTASRVEVFRILKDKYGLRDSDLIGSEQFSASVSSEIKWNAFWSILIASILMLAYITVRFEAVFGFAAIASLIHDILFLLAIYAIFRFPVNSTFIAAILTVVGYSINDTIVVFDRIREDIKGERIKDYADTADRSVRRTFSRTINTTVTTLLVIGSLLVFGVSSIKEFALPLFIGIGVGTYSSIFIASASWALIRDRIAKKGKYGATAKN